MWLYICSSCGFKIRAEKVGECPRCQANSWICHSADISQEIIGEKPDVPARGKTVKSKQLALL